MLNILLIIYFRHKKDGQPLKGQYKYVKLHTNRKTIYAGETSEKNIPSIEDLEPKIQVLLYLKL